MVTKSTKKTGSVASRQVHVPKQWQGKNFERTEREPLERVFAEQWARQCETFGIFGYLFGENGWPVREENIGPRDREIASTVIQWLGSHVGQMFLREVLDEAGKRRISHRIARSPVEGEISPRGSARSARRVSRKSR